MTKEIDIKELRKRRGWTQPEMADHFGVNLHTVWRWENKHIPTRGLARRLIEREWKAVADEATV